jgi:hypothetical protein
VSGRERHRREAERQGMNRIDRRRYRKVAHPLGLIIDGAIVAA